jgi:hypothetical protein
VQTAAAWGLTLDGPAPAHPTNEAELTAPPAADLVLQQWLPVAQFLNAMNRSLGHHDAYPFQMPDAVLAKMETVRELLAQSAQSLALANSKAKADLESSQTTEPAAERQAA